MKPAGMKRNETKRWNPTAMIFILPARAGFCANCYPEERDCDSLKLPQWTASAFLVMESRTFQLQISRNISFLGGNVGMFEWGPPGLLFLYRMSCVWVRISLRLSSNRRIPEAHFYNVTLSFMSTWVRCTVLSIKDINKIICYYTFFLK